MNSPNNWGLQIDPAVLKALRKIPRHDAEKIVTVIQALACDPFFGDIKKMQGSMEIWRKRVGSYRIFYKLVLPQRVIFIFRVERRTSHTY
jgi:mRNA-degrading endonuclease RelE of RelBE toxin-antitoxin system